MLRLYFLGEQRVSEAAASVTPSLVVGRALEILAALVVNAGRPQERERLAGLQWYWKADMFAEISDAAIDAHAKYGALLPTGHSTMHMYPIDGAAMRVDAAATAFPYRGGGWAGTIVGVDPDPANAAAITEWAKAYWNELHPTSAGGVYVNFLGQEVDARVRSAYGANYDRLARVKAQYDPHNVFHINQNIAQAGAPAG